MYFNTHGQIYVGKIVYMPKPCDTISCASGMVYGLEGVGSNPITITAGKSLICSDKKLIVDGVEYFVGDKVMINGMRTPVIMCSDSTFYTDISYKTIKKYSYYDGNTQHFLGTYSITAMCGNHWGGFSETRTGVIEKGVDSDLLIQISRDSLKFKAFVLNDSSFIIPMQYLVVDEWGTEYYLYGNGVIRNDSICLSYGYGSVYGFYTDVACDNCNESSNIVLLPANPNKVYYDAIKQEIVIDEALQNQSLTLELYDIQGKILLRQTNISNSISIAYLPQGVYVYRLLQGNQVICRGKVLK
jgi:hypothetical protein